MSDYQVVRYRTDEGCVHGVRGPEGRKYLPIVYLETTGVVVRRVPKDHVRRMEPIAQTVQRAAATLLNVGTRRGITKGAQDFLSAATAGREVPIEQPGEPAAPIEQPGEPAAVSEGKPQPATAPENPTRPRGGVGARAKELILQGLPTGQVVATIRAEFPGSKTSARDVSIYRSQLRREGRIA